MNDVILKVENVSKLYRLGTVGTGTFGGDVQRFWKTKVLGQEDPFLKVGQTNDRKSKDKADFVWALQDINFEVKRGEVLGIIGKNGAGKSTLLKLLSRITTPTTGSIKSAGRMASLLEVGTGFHPELTGRENIFLNGAILGMTKKEIQRKFDEIVDFSGCALYIDTPAKRYSSGMTVRLGFAVAAFLDPEILVVDEVLAVGDAEFQKRAIGKMKDVSSESGKTILFVSHNLSAINSLCSRGVVLNNGRMVHQGTVVESLNFYKSTVLSEAVSQVKTQYFTEEVKDLKVQVLNREILEKDILEFNLGDEINLEISCLIVNEVNNLSIALDIVNENNDLIAHIVNEDDGFYGLNNKTGLNKVLMKIEQVLLIPGVYFINLWIGKNQKTPICRQNNALVFRVLQGEFTRRSTLIPSNSHIFIPSRWKLI